MKARGDILIESEGLLFRGPSIDEPTEVWHYFSRKWVPYRPLGGMSGGPFGVQIDDERAEGLKSDNLDAEHFGYYDIPPWV